MTPTLRKKSSLVDAVAVGHLTLRLEWDDAPFAIVDTGHPARQPEAGDGYLAEVHHGDDLQDDKVGRFVVVREARGGLQRLRPEVYHQPVQVLARHSERFGRDDRPPAHFHVLKEDTGTDVGFLDT